MANPNLRTRHNYDAFEVVSALQKCIRRGLEEDALIGLTNSRKSPNKNYYTWLWARLKVIACEDVGPANPIMPLLIDVLWRNWKEKKEERLWYTNAVVALVRSPKSRIVDNALNKQLSEDELGWRRDKPIPYEENEPIPLGSVDESKLENPAPPTDFTRKIPWFAMDMHTPAGKQYGLGKKDFYENGAVLVNKALDDPYEARGKTGDFGIRKATGKRKQMEVNKVFLRNHAIGSPLDPLRTPQLLPTTLTHTCYIPHFCPTVPYRFWPESTLRSAQNRPFA